MDILSRKIKDNNIRWLVKLILQNHVSDRPGTGMPLGNWTSQFFANVYLNELDQFVKHELKAKYYLRYVDDFVILHESKDMLRRYRCRIQEFLSKIWLELHPQKCRIIPLSRGVDFLGYRIFYHHKLLRRKNLRKIWNRLQERLDEHIRANISAWEVLDTLAGWKAYAMHANTQKLQQQMQRHVETELQNIAKYRTFMDASEYS